MTIQQCKCVLEIAKFGSINKAAKNLFVAQTSVSFAVKTLEQELGIQIFERSNRGVILTDEGAEFVRYASQIVEQSDFILSRYSGKRKKKRLSVSTQHYDFVAEMFGKLLHEYQGEELRFSLKEIKTYDIITDVENAVSELGVLAIKASDRKLMERFLSERRITFVPLIKTLPHVYVRKDHPLAKEERITQDKLERYPYISYEQGSHNNSFFVEELGEIGNRTKCVEITDRATLMNFLLVSDCYTVGTGIMTSKLNGGNIVSVPLESEEWYFIGYIVKEETRLGELTQKLIDMLIEFSKQYQ